MITNETDLASAILNAKDGDVISTESIIAVSKPLPPVKHRIEFYLRTQYMARQNGVNLLQPMLTIHKSCEFVSCILKGYHPTLPTTWQEDGIQCIIKIDGANYVEVKGSVFSHSSYAALWQFDCDMVYINAGTEFDNCAVQKEGYGFGYGIWQGGKGDAYGQQLIVQDCEFSNNRHHIAGSYHPNDMTIQRCEFSSNEFGKQMIDRHGRDGKGGRNLTVTDCIFHNENNYAYDLAQHSGKVSFYGNTFARESKNGRVGGKIVDFDK